MLKEIHRITKWYKNQEELLKSAIRLISKKENYKKYFRKIAPFLYNLKQNSEKVPWTGIALECSKGIENIFHFKTDKQCKEKWLNHLNPLLNRYFSILTILVKKFN